MSELLVATGDRADEGLSGSIQEVLAAFRRQVKMDVAFVSRFHAGRRIFEAVDADPRYSAIQAGGSDPIEDSWCGWIVQGKAPEVIADAKPLMDAGGLPSTTLAIGTHLSVPVRLRDGSAYGTVCCFSEQVKQDYLEADYAVLRAIAKLLADRLDAQAPARDAA